MPRMLELFDHFRLRNSDDCTAFFAAFRRRCRLLSTAVFAAQHRVDEIHQFQKLLPVTKSKLDSYNRDPDTVDANLSQCDSDVVSHDNVSSVGAGGQPESRQDEAVLTDDFQPTDGPDAQHLVIGQRLAERIANSLLHARSVTEQATLSVGQHVSELFEIARRDNTIAEETLRGIIGADDQSGQDDGMAAIVSQQRSLIDRFVSETKACFQRQVEFSSKAVAACRDMDRSVAAIEKLVFSSEILAFNVQVESIRLGEQGRAFSVLGEEMVRFSTQVSQANAAMQKSLATVCETMQRLHGESVAVDDRLSDFSTSLFERMRGVQERTERLTDSLIGTLQRITSSNEVLMSHSQNALSELQFQDPLAQDLLRTHHEVLKIQSLLKTGYCEDTSLADIDPAVGHDGTEFRDAGEVELF